MQIHWRSLPGSTAGSMGSAIDIANRGQIRFYRKSPTACSVKLTISYELPDALAPFGNVRSFLCLPNDCTFSMPSPLAQLSGDDAHCCFANFLVTWPVFLCRA